CSSCAPSGAGPRGILRAGASVPPGAVATTRIPSRAASPANAAVSPLTPPFAAESGTRLIPRVAMDETLTIVPLPPARIAGNTARDIHGVGSKAQVIAGRTLR